MLALRHSPTHPLFTRSEPTTVFLVSTHPALLLIPPLAQFDWWLERGGDGHHPAGAGTTAATMPGRTLHQGAGMEEEGVVDQQQTEWDQVWCTADRWTRFRLCPRDLLIFYCIYCVSGGEKPESVRLGVNRRVS